MFNKQRKPIQWLYKKMKNQYKDVKGYHLKLAKTNGKYQIVRKATKNNPEMVLFDFDKFDSFKFPSGSIELAISVMDLFNRNRDKKMTEHEFNKAMIEHFIDAMNQADKDNVGNLQEDLKDFIHDVLCN